MNARPETDLELSNARLQVLAEASRAFALVATEYPLLLPRIARTTADLVGDGCIVTLIGGDGRSEERRVGKECRSRWSPYH